MIVIQLLIANIAVVVPSTVVLAIRFDLRCPFNSLMSASDSLVSIEIVELVSQLELSDQKNHFPRF